MLSNNEVILGYKNLYDKGELSKENGYSDRWVYFHLLAYRATLLKQKKDRAKLSNYNFQTITLNLEKVDNLDLNCDLPTNCTILRTVVPIPNFIALDSVTSPINTVGEVVKYTEINPDLIKYKALSRLPSSNKDTYFYLQNTGKGVYVYVVSNSYELSKSASIKMIAYSPEKLQAIKDCDGNLDPCFNYKQAEFIIDSELISTMYSMAFNGFFKIKTQGSDNSVDGKDSMIANPAPLK